MMARQGVLQIWVGLVTLSHTYMKLRKSHTVMSEQSVLLFDVSIAGVLVKIKNVVTMFPS